MERERCAAHDGYHNTSLIFDISRRVIYAKVERQRYLSSPRAARDAAGFPGRAMYPRPQRRQLKGEALLPL